MCEVGLVRDVMTTHLEDVSVVGEGLGFLANLAAEAANKVSAVRFCGPVVTADLLCAEVVHVV